jgi:glycosyltransferase involved in cell wall biosynthesis
MNTRLVSVIVPVYNGAKFLREALESVSPQNYAPMEIIVIDDGSTDETAQVVQAFTEQSRAPVQYVYQENRGPAAARNHGLGIARGDIIAFQDADDVWTQDKLAVQLDLLARHPSASVVLGFTRLTQMSGQEQVIGQSGLVTVLQAALFRRTVFDQVGVLNEDLRLGEDVDWYLRALEQDVQIITHQDVVLFYRRHAANLTCSRQETNAHLLLAIRRSLVRRRQSDDPSRKWLASFIVDQE